MEHLKKLSQFPIVHVYSNSLDEGDLSQTVAYLNEISTLERIVMDMTVSELTPTQIQLFKYLPIQRVKLRHTFFDLPLELQNEIVTAISRLQASITSIVPNKERVLTSDHLSLLEPLSNIRISSLSFNITTKTEARKLATAVSMMKNLNRFTIFTDRTMCFVADIFREKLPHHKICCKEFDLCDDEMHYNAWLFTTCFKLNL